MNVLKQANHAKINEQTNVKVNKYACNVYYILYCSSCSVRCCVYAHCCVSHCACSAMMATAESNLIWSTWDHSSAGYRSPARWIVSSLSSFFYFLSSMNSSWPMGHIISFIFPCMEIFLRSFFVQVLGFVSLPLVITNINLLNQSICL